MLRRVLGAVALSLVFLSFNSAANAGAIQRMTCSAVRFYVAKYSAWAAESYARSHGASDAQIEAARHCLRDEPAQKAEAVHWFTR
jgi:hypothetical protein